MSNRRIGCNGCSADPQGFSTPAGLALLNLGNTVLFIVKGIGSAL